MKKYLPVLLGLALLPVSCSRNALFENCSYEVHVPENVVSLEQDIMPEGLFPEVGNPLGLQIVRDSILVVHDPSGEGNDCHFKAYDLSSGSYMGAFMAKGRGPGEMVSLHIAKCSSDEYNLYLNDNSLGIFFEVDIPGSISDKRASVVRSSTYPINTVDWLPLPGSGSFSLSHNDGRLAYSVSGENGEVLHSIDFRDGLGEESKATYLSSIMTVNGQGKIASAMLCFPQVHFIDSRTGHVNSVSVIKDEEDWKTTVGKNFDLNTMQYFSGIMSTPEYVFALYSGASLQSIMTGDCRSSVYVFDWQGKLVRAMKAGENLGALAYDRNSARLYAVDKSAGRIVRYDLRGLLD